MKGHMSTTSPLSKRSSKLSFIFENFNLIPWNIHFFIQVSVAARYRLKTVSQKDKPMLLRCKSLHSFKICYIAELLPESRVTCLPPANNRICNARCRDRGFRSGECDKFICRCFNVTLWFDNAWRKIMSTHNRKIYDCWNFFNVYGKFH